MSLTPRERVLLALDHQVTDRVPIAMVCAGIHAPVRAEMEEILRRERGLGLDEYLTPLIDVRSVAPQYIGPTLPPQTDMWGVRRAPIDFGLGEYNEIEHYPLSQVTDLSELDGHVWPTTDWFDYSLIPERIAALEAQGEYCLMIANGNIFECSWYMRGFEQIFTDLVLEPELSQAIFTRVRDFFCDHFERILGAADGRIDLAFTADDIGGQQGLLMSLDMWQEQLQPHHAKLNEVIHRHGAKVIYHSDGSVMEAVPGLLDMGIDILQALQFDCLGMDPVKLKDEYGDRLCFEGGISVQQTLPFGSVEQVIDEVEQRIRVLGRDGGYILGPSHMIQPGTPAENVIAMFDTAANCEMCRSRPG